jgi:hypothetical protein
LEALEIKAYCGPKACHLPRTSNDPALDRPLTQWPHSLLSQVLKPFQPMTKLCPPELATFWNEADPAGLTFLARRGLEGKILV